MPTYDENHVLLRFGGPAHNGQEIWSCGLRLRHVGGDSLDPMRQDATDTIEEIAGICADYVSNVDAGFSGNVQLAEVKLDVIRATTGKYAFPDNPNTFLVEPPVPGTAGALPPQVAYAVTARGTYRRGPAARGRWYVPCGNLGTQADGRMSETIAQNAADAAGDFLSALREVENGAGPNTWTPYLYGDGVGGSRSSVYTSLEVGRVYDTQRRRRNSLIEEYVAATNYPA